MESGMGIRHLLSALLLISVVSTITARAGVTQSNGKLVGKVLLKESGGPLHGAIVLLVELGQSAISGEDGSFELNRVPPGAYQVIAHLDSLFTEETKSVTVAAGGIATVDFSLELVPPRYEITVSGAEKEETTLESFQSVESIGPFDLAGSAAVSLGETLDHQVGTGIAKRSFGPGSSRPIIRGFDGDRVLIMEDGIRTGTLSSQSGDHGELINPTQLERLEIVKGPATLLYSGNAMGGTVNAISRHHQIHRHPHAGLRGFVSGSVGTTNTLGGSSAGFEYGIRNWMIWSSGGGVRIGDYSAAQQGEIFNSRSRTANGGGGFGWYGDRMFFGIEGKYDDGIYGVPFATDFHGEEEGGHDFHGEEEGDHAEEVERIQLDSRRQSYRFNWGLRNLESAIESFVLKLGYTDWAHDEIEILSDGDREIGTEFEQRQFVYRGVFEQKKRGPLSGRFGFWGLGRDYSVAGEEALSSPVNQTGFAVFGLEELDFDTIKFQFGGRFETQRFRPDFSKQRSGPQEEGPGGGSLASKRTSSGVSTSAGIHADIWNDGVVVFNYSHSYRAPALEELYNFGPHVGNLAFEIGDPSLLAETGDGVEVSLRQSSKRLEGEMNFFYYDFEGFVFPFATGEARDGLQEIRFTQRAARFIGTEAKLGIGFHQNLWLNLGLDFVDAQDTDTNTSLPRIPPLRGKAGLAFNYLGFRFTPELILASRQHQTFTGETQTPGYGVVNLKAAYSFVQKHLAHQISVNVFNVGDRLYRNHSSFIKNLAPEIGRGVRLAYMVRFF